MYTGSHNGLPTLALIGHQLQNILIGEAREDGGLRLERVLYNPTFRTNAGADVIALLRFDDATRAWVYVWQVRVRLLHAPGPLTTAARTLLGMGYDPIRAQRTRALRDSVDQSVPALMELEAEEA